MSRTVRRALAGALTIALAACGGGSPPAPAVDAARSTLAAAPSSATADGVASVRLTATARDADGAPIPGRLVTFTVTGAVTTLTSATATTGADGSTAVTLTSTVAGTKEVSASIDGVAVAAKARATFVAGPAALVTFSAQPASGTAGAPFGLAVTAADAHGNPIDGGQVTLSLQDGAASASLTGAVAATTSASGAASFTDLRVYRAGSGYAVVATCGAAQVTSAAFDIAAGAPSPADSRVTASPATVMAGGAPATVTVAVLDRFGNPVADAIVEVSSSAAGDTVVGPGPTAADGTANAAVGGTSAGARTITAFVVGVPLLQTAAVTVLPASPDAASSFATGPGAVVADGSAASISATIRDAYGNPVPGLALALSATGGTVSVGSVLTGTGGEAVASVSSTVAGSATVTIAFAGGSLDVPVTFVAGPAAALQLTGLAAGVTAGGASTVTVTAFDAHGNVAAGYRGTVHLAATDPGAVLPADLAFDDADAGRRAAQVELRTAGSRSLTAADVAAPALTATAATVVAPGTAAGLLLSGLASPVAAGGPLTATATARDAYGNVATGYRGGVRLTSTDGAAVLPGDYAFQASDAGSHAFSGLQLRTAGTQAVTVADTTAPGLTATSAGLVVNAAAASALTFTVQPASALAGDLLAPAVQVAVRDAFGNLVTAPTPVALGLTGGTGGAALLGATTAFSLGGLADFAGLSIQAASAGYALTASSEGLTGATSQPFAIAASAPDAAVSDVAAAPTSLAAGATSTLSATVRDAFGNRIAGATVTFEATGSSNALSAPAVTDAAGAAAGSLSSTKAEPKSVTAKVGALVLAGHPVVAFTAGAPDPAESSMATSPASVPDDGTPVALTVTVADAYGNPIAGQAVIFAASGTASFTGAAAATAADGTTSGTVSSLVAGTQTISAHVGPTLVAQRDVIFTAAPPSPSTSTVTVAPASVPADGASAATATVTVKDGLGRPVEGATVALACSATSSIEPPTAPTSAGGVATFMLTSGVVGSGVLTATVDPGAGGVVIAQQPTLGFVAPTFAVGGIVSGLTTGGLVLSTAGQADLPVPAGAASFAFGSKVSAGTTYAVSVQAQPAGQTCKVLNGSGVVAGADVSGIVIDCAATWKQVAAAYGYSVGVKTDGSLYTWGQNTYGQLGDGSTMQRNAPTLIGSGFAMVATGYDHAVAVKSDGSLYAWGGNGSGQLGDGTTAQRLTPGLIGSGFTAVAAGNYHTAALKTDGSVYAWGQNSYGQLGDGSTTQRTVPVLIGSGFASVAAGSFHTVALKTDGSVYAWGQNSHGQLGDGSAAQRNVPVLVGSGLASVAAGDSHTVALKIGGVLVAWGYNSCGQIGDGSYTQRNAPVVIGSGFASVAAGGQHTVAVKADGSLYAWGQNTYGQLGDGSTTQRTLPVLIGSGFATVAAGAQHTVAVKVDGSLYGLGWNAYGQLGDGSNSQRRSPARLGLGFASIASGLDHGVGVKANGDLYAWGENSYGQVGDGSTTRRDAPVLIGSGFASAAAGSSFTLALKTDGSLYGWGYNGNGQLGDGSVTQRTRPVLIGSGFASVAVGTYHAVAVKTDGSLYAWGSNSVGQLGDGSTTDRNRPILIGSGFASVAAGFFHTVAVKTAGSLYAWGWNGYGQLGDGSTIQRSTPVFVGPGFTSVAAGAFHSVAVQLDGSLLTWGQNNFGQLGNGSNTPSSLPARVDSGAAAVAAGQYHTVAVKTDGSLYAWGYNAMGQLGDGSTTHRTVPVLIGAGFASSAAGGYQTLAVRLDGSLWAWGLNDYGQLGDGLASQYPKPVPATAMVFGLAYAPTPVSCTRGLAIAPTVPTSTGGPISSYAVSPALPDGLLLDAATGVLSGTPRARSPLTSYVVTATGPTGTTTTALLTITVN